MANAQFPYGPPPGYGQPAGPPGYPGFVPPAGSFGEPPPDSLGTGPRPDGLGIAALIFGILGLLGALLNLLSGLLGTCCIICTVGSTFLALIAMVPCGTGAVMGWVSMSRIRRHPRRLTGKGLALAALIISSAGILICILEIVIPWLGLGLLEWTGTVRPSSGSTPHWHLPPP